MDPALRELLLRGAGSDDVEAIIRFDDETCTAPAGVAVVAQFGTIATCRLRRRDVPRVREAPGIASLKAPRLLGPDIATVAAGSATVMPGDARRPEGIVETGRGVVLGVLDWGLDIAAAAFRHVGGGTRVLALWDQRTRRGARQRNAYGYGWIHSQRAIDAALRTPDPYAALRYDPADSDPGAAGAHGTVVTELAAGNGRSGGLRGVAPECDIVFVHLASRDTTGLAHLGDSIGILEGVDFVRRVAAGRPVVCSMSVGRHAGPHDGSTLVELGLDAFLAGGPNRAIAQSAGNYARRRCHASGPLVPGHERALSLIIDASDVTQNEIEVWHDCAACAVDLELPDGTRSGWTKLGEVSDVMRGDRVIARLYHRRSDPQNGSHHVDAFIAVGAPGGRWTMRIRDGRVSGPPTTFHAWIERDDACPTCQSRFDAGDEDPSCTLGTLATGRGPIVCGAYDAHDATRPLGTFSSAGPTRDGRPKPDIVAPGVGVLSLRSRPRGHAPGANVFTRRTGTSMAAPQVAGCAALILEAGRGALGSAEVRDLVLAGTDVMSSRAPRRTGDGPGDLDIARALEATRRYVTASPSKKRKDVRTMDATLNLGHLGRALDDVWQPHLRDLSAWMAESRRALDQRYHRLASHAAGAADTDVEVLARAGDVVVHALQPGDGLLRIARGEPGLGHVAVLVDGRLMSRDEAIASGFTCENGPAGLYAWIVDAGARPHRADDRFARLVATRSGTVPAGQMIVRPRDLGAVLGQTSAEGALLWSDDGEFDGGATGDPIARLPLVGDDEGADGGGVNPGDEGA
ncbi:MAG: S8 family serine peptidase, partial [Acidobacteria bacterium]|nr:S8 family serine peptidase [Acidobacteriota bacterium]